MENQPPSFGLRLHHDVPPWADPGAVFHIRIRCEAETPLLLTDPALGQKLLDSVRVYQERQLWHTTLFLLMPDHLHALIAFPRDKSMSRVLGDWKRYHAAHNGVRWQSNYFDHRLRNAAQAEYKFQYILNNPVVKGLCAAPDHWPWKWLPE